jgi:hypothetical protein
MAESARLLALAPDHLEISSLAGWELSRNIERKGMRRAGPLVLGKLLHRYDNGVAIGAGRSKKASFC